jgi:hypothetical protein
VIFNFMFLLSRVEAYKPKEYGPAIIVERRLHREGNTAYKLKDHTGKRTVATSFAELSGEWITSIHEWIKCNETFRNIGSIQYSDNESVRYSDARH